MSAKHFRRVGASKRLRILGSLLFICIMSPLAQSYADTVAVWGERFNLNTINNFYNGLTGHTSSILGPGTLDTFDISAVDLLWAVQPANSYTAAELASMSTFLGGGGRIAFMGEHGGFAPNENNRITAALLSLGSTMSIINTTEDGGDRDATRAGGQILNHSLTQGVDTYNYAAFAPLNLGANGQALMMGSNLTSVMMGFENVGPGSIFLITDQNVFDSVRLNSPDNGRMFENLLQAATGAPPPGPNPIPEPSTMILFGSGLAGLAAWRMRKSQ